MAKRTANLGDFSKAVEQILDESVKDLTEQLEDGLDEAQDYLIQQMRESSPVSTGDYADHWKAGEKGDRVRIVKNDKKVSWKGKQVPLAGILEYSTKHSSPHIQKTRKKAKKHILEILKDALKVSEK